MKRLLYNVVLSLVLILMSFSVCAEKFTFSFKDIITNKNDVVDAISAHTDVELVNHDGKNNFTLTIMQTGKSPRVYTNLELINYTDDDNGHFMSFTADDKHIFCFAIWYVNFTNVMIEIDGDDIYYYYDVMRHIEREEDEEFENEFNRLKDFCIDDSNAKSAKTSGSQSATDSKQSSPSRQIKAENKPAAAPKPTIAGLPSEVKETPLSEIKNKILSNRPGGSKGLRFVRDHKELTPLTLMELIEHPLGVKSAGWSEIRDDILLFKTLVANDLGFEANYKFDIGGIYGKSTALNVWDKLVLLPPIDFGTFDVRWATSGSGKPQIYISYDAGGVSGYPYFSYEFKIGPGDPGHIFEKKKTTQLIRQSFEAFLTELKNKGFKVERDKIDKNGYAYSKGPLSGKLSLFINKYQPELSELQLSIQHSK